jgi:hypothetical protein
MEIVHKEQDDILIVSIDGSLDAQFITRNIKVRVEGKNSQ